MSMMQMLLGAAGSVPVYVENVFSVDIYDGNEGTQTITNDIDLSGKGGMVWIKCRSDNRNHIVSDTIRGTNSFCSMNTDSDAGSQTNQITSFNGNGFTLGSGGDVNGGTDDYVAWTFRKCPGFFDIVAYDATGPDAGVAGRQVPHDLGCKPGMIWVKKLNASGNWSVYHKSMHASEPEDYRMTLDYYMAPQDKLGAWNDTAPTKTHFTLGDDGDHNSGTAGSKYIAYLFADGDDPDAQVFGAGGNESILKMGSYDGTGSTGYGDVDAGWEVQWILAKMYTGVMPWGVYDTTRGMSGTADGSGVYFKEILPTDNDEEDDKTYKGPDPQSDGIHMWWGNGVLNGGVGDNYIYTAIRKPMN